MTLPPMSRWISPGTLAVISRPVAPTDTCRRGQRLTGRHDNPRSFWQCAGAGAESGAASVFAATVGRLLQTSGVSAAEACAQLPEAVWAQSGGGQVTFCADGLGPEGRHVYLS